jgi:hypothetical protein
MPGQRVQTEANNLFLYDTTIPSGQSLSGTVALLGRALVGIYMPAAWTTATITYQGSRDGSTWLNVYTSAGAEMNHTVDADRYVPLDVNDWVGLIYLRIRSGTSSVTVNQSADRVLYLAVRDVRGVA